MIIIEETRL